MIHPVPCCCDRAPEIVVGTRGGLFVMFSGLSGTRSVFLNQTDLTDEYRSSTTIRTLLRTDNLENTYGKFGTGAGNTDRYLTKYDSTMTPLWSYDAQTSTSAIAWAHIDCVLDQNLNVYLVRRFSGTILGTFNLRYNITKLNSSGTEVWVGSVISNTRFPEAIACDRSFNSVVAGQLRASAGDIEGDAALWHYDSSGTEDWEFELSAYDFYQDVAGTGTILTSRFGNVITDVDGGIYAGIGFVSESNTGIIILTDPPITLFKVDSSGSEVWHGSFGSKVYSICMDSSENLYLVYREQDSGNVVFATPKVRAAKVSGDTGSVEWDVDLTSNIDATVSSARIGVSPSGANLYIFHSVSSSKNVMRLSTSNGSIQETGLLADTSGSEFGNQIALDVHPGLYPIFR